MRTKRDFSHCSESRLRLRGLEWDSILRGKPRKMEVLAVIPGMEREMDRRQGLKEQRPSTILREAQTRLSALPDPVCEISKK